MLPTLGDFATFLPHHWPVPSLDHASLDDAVHKIKQQRAKDRVTLFCTLSLELGTMDWELDVVQTRACRVDLDGCSTPIVAPIFDLINHGASSANAYYLIDDHDLVVRTSRRLVAGEQVLLAWRCLINYGFVGESSGEDTAELVVGGRSDTVTSSTVPPDLLRQLTPEASDENDLEFTPSLAMDVAELAQSTAEQRRQGNYLTANATLPKQALHSLSLIQIHVLDSLATKMEHHKQRLWQS